MASLIHMRLHYTSDLLGYCLICGSCLMAGAEEATTVAAAVQSSIRQEAEGRGTVSQIPQMGSFLSGFNAGVAYYQVHDSAIGWYNVVAPAVSFSFSDRYSADASVTIYPRRAIPVLNPPPIFGESYRVTRGDLGDAQVGFHARFDSRAMGNTLTASLTVPTGNQLDGLGTGKVNIDFSDHIEFYSKRAVYLLDLGAGNSSGFFNTQMAKDYNSVGLLTHYEAGVLYWFLGNNYIQSVAYEQLPVGGQTVFTFRGPPGAEDFKVVTGNGINEDNGFTSVMGIPLTDHLTLMGYYNRSLRRSLDTASIGFTYVLRSTHGKARISMADKALQEVQELEREQQQQ
jgi:hypothetical protein